MTLGLCGITLFSSNVAELRAIEPRLREAKVAYEGRNPNGNSVHILEARAQ